MRKQTPELLIGQTREAFLRRLIAEAGMTIKDFAKKAEIPVTSMGTILKRGVGTTSLDTAFKICKALDIDIETLAGYENPNSRAIIDISERLRCARYNLRYRADILAEILDISSLHYSRFETPGYPTPLKYIRALSQIMDIPLDYLTGESSLSFPINVLEESNSPEEFELYDLGCAISSFRELRQLSQEDLSALLQKPVDLIEQWELRIRVPSLEDINALCIAFSSKGNQVKPSDFYAFPAEPEPLILSAKERKLLRRYQHANEKDQRIVDLLIDLAGT